RTGRRAGQYHGLVAALAVETGEVGGKVRVGRGRGKGSNEAEADDQGNFPLPLQIGEEAACPCMTNATLTQLLTPHACAGAPPLCLARLLPETDCMGAPPRRSTGPKRLVVRVK